MTNDHVGNGLTRFDAILELGVDCPFSRSLSRAYTDVNLRTSYITGIFK